MNIEHCVHMKVKENGWEVEEDENGIPIIDKIDYRIELGNPVSFNVDKNNRWSAFTVAELGKIFSTQKGFFDSGFRRVGVNEWQCRYFEGTNSTDGVHHAVAENEANARAKMLIYLLENKLMELPNET